MQAKGYTVSEIAAMFGISVRTMHYYDEIGLVTPSVVSQSGYRYYDDDNIALLQQVLFYRELEFSLREIAELINRPDYDCRDAFKRQRELLLFKRELLNDLLALLDESIAQINNDKKEGIDMSKTPKITAADIESARKKYADETRERWGGTAAYRESAQKEIARTDSESGLMAAEMDGIFAGFASILDQPVDSEQAFELVRQWQEHITKWHYRCSDEILACLGEMYVADERFTENLDRFGDGTAQYMSDAIKAYCAKSAQQ